MGALAVQVGGGDLGSAGEPVGQDRGARSRVADGWPQAVFGAGGGDVVVAAFEAEVSGEAAAA